MKEPGRKFWRRNDNCTLRPNTFHQDGYEKGKHFAGITKGLVDLQFLEMKDSRTKSPKKEKKTPLTMGRPLDQNLIHTTVNVLHVQPVCLITHLTQSHIQWLLEILKKRCSFNLDIILRQTGTKSCNANHLGDTLTTVTKEQENIAGVGSRNDSAKPNSKFNQNNNNPMTEKIFLQEEGSL